MKHLKIQFGIPEHGWLPVELTHKEYTLKMDVSDIPVDPIHLLISALLKVIEGRSSEVWWNLEPKGYYFTFQPKGNDDYSIKIESAENTRGVESRSTLFSTSGNLENLLTPFWRALRKFESQGYTEPHWPDFPETEMSQLTKVIKID